MVAKHLTPELWEKLSGIKTKTSGFTLAKAIACAVEFGDHVRGLLPYPFALCRAKISIEKEYKTVSIFCFCSYFSRSLSLILPSYHPIANYHKCLEYNLFHFLCSTAESTPEMKTPTRTSRRCSSPSSSNTTDSRLSSLTPPTWTSPKSRVTSKPRHPLSPPGTFEKRFYYPILSVPKNREIFFFKFQF